MIDDQYHGKLTTRSALKAIKKIRKAEVES